MSLTTDPREALVIRRGAGGKPQANIPFRYTHHSPDGVEFGYQGSGPADLALNVAVFYAALLGYRPQPQGESAARLWDGQHVHPVAWNAYQDIKREIVAKLPFDGGTIPPENILAIIRRFEH